MKIQKDNYQQVYHTFIEPYIYQDNKRSSEKALLHNFCVLYEPGIK